MWNKERVDYNFIMWLFFQVEDVPFIQGSVEKGEWSGTTGHWIFRWLGIFSDASEFFDLVAWVVVAFQLVDRG